MSPTLRAAIDTAAGGRQRAVIYCRISRDREGAGLGVTRQREDCEELAEQLGLQVVEVYEDNDLSAYSGKPRPDYRRMLDDLRDGRAGTVLAWHTDRLHRSPAELEEYIDVCEPRRVETRTVKAGHLDLTTATGRMIARQLGVQARYEVERMVERQRRKRDEMAAKGQHFGGRRPFGWEKDGMSPIEFEFDCIREAAQSILAGASLRSLAAGWEARGIKTSTGSTWKGPEVRSMLLRPRNAGIVQHRGEEVGAGQWPAPLDEGTWRSVCAVLTDPARRLAPGNERKYLGSGVYLCGLCADGTTMRAATSNSRNPGSDTRYWGAYTCRDKKHLSRRRDLVDDAVQLALLDRLAQPDAADLLAQRENPVDVRGAQRDMREARATLDELASALGSGAMDMRSYRVASETARARLAAAEATMSRAVTVNPVAALVDADDPDAVWNEMDLSRRRAAVAYLMTVTILPARVGRQPGGGYWDPESIRIEWK
ncbi:recombinase family protein [Streptomyces nitrosporeus]|uniref:Recombinase family protein n=1 Tax=Streptomyces nitrosporeus TaxID=28894 RepID=A0A5J6F8A0_9ACTN|nr:recombinase family protein [Streptomyces nitrosporeus]QEU72047.1 recombinase family protein [Streptomyces nitrosporeus]GGY80981.1 serine recombinase [Streptomyces nitrosporeus]